MFNNLEKTKNQKTTTKILATLLVLTLTFSNLAILGNVLISYALDSNADNTNIDNVKFDVYVAEEGRKEISADFNADDLKLGIRISVENGGLFKDGVLSLEDTSFRFKEDEKLTSLSVGTIQSGQYIQNELDIVAVRNQDYDLGLLNMPSKIKLKGTYINNEGNEETVESVKTIRINWNADNVEDENQPITLNQELITNKIYNIDGNEKRVIQLRVTSGIESNIYPIKDTKIELNNPILPNNNEPEDIKVVSYGTFASNGDNGFKFDSWTYNNEEKKLTITVQNDENNNIIKWNKNAEDKFIVTYVYDKDVDITTIASEINSEINLYGTTEKKLTAQSKINLDNIEEKGEAITQKLQVLEKLYKSNMKLGEETQLDENYILQVGYAKIADKIVLSNQNKEFGVNEGENTSAKTYYKYSVFNKAELLKIFGEEGTLTISYLDENNQKQNITVLNKDTETEDNGSITVKYDDKYETIIFETSKPVVEGQLKIINRLGIEPVEEELIPEINKILSRENLKVDNSINNLKSAEIAIENPITQVALGIDKANLSSTQSSDINITATLKTDGLKYDLYTNPTIKIIMPEEINKIELNENPKLLGGNGLSIEDTKIEGNVITIQLNGEQKTYTGDDTQILINAKIKSRKLIPTLSREIVMQCTNNKETVYTDSESEFAQSSKGIKIIAEKGILLANSISNYDGDKAGITAFKKEQKTVVIGKQEDQVATIKGIIINNEEKDIESLEVVGKINGKLVSPINMENATIYYTQDETVSKDSNWNEEFNEDAAGYKLVIDIKNGEIAEFNYQVLTSTIISGDLDYDVIYDNSEIKSPSIKMSTEEIQEPERHEATQTTGGPDEPEEKLLSMEIVSNPDNTQVLKPGQEIILNINITNLKEPTQTEPREKPFYGDEEDSNEPQEPEEQNNEEPNSNTGDYVIFEGVLSEGLVAKEAKVTTPDEGTRTIDLFSINEFNITNMLESKTTENIELKLQVDEEILVSEVTGMLSTKIILPKNTGTDPDVFVGEMSEKITYMIEQDGRIININVPEKIELNVDETKSIGLQITPENASLDNLKLSIEDESIAEIVNNTEIKATDIGKTVLTVETLDGRIKKTIEIVITDPSNPGKPADDDVIEEPKDNPQEPAEPGEEPEEKTYSISGVAWLDDNKDGIKDDSEKLLSGVIVRIKDKATGKYLKYENDEEIAVMTDFNGVYKFENLKDGEYVLEFSFNTKKYKLTPKTGKDSVAYLLTVDDKTLITTETIKVNKANVEKMNIGLVLNDDFDLSINKYITKAIVQNGEGTKEYTFDKTKLGKVEIGGKYVSGSTVIVEYVIEVKNNGKIPGYAKKIVDYVSPEFKFSADMNKNWYQESDNNLYTEELADVEIQPGETKEVKLILTKTMTNSNLGLINNSAEIFEDYNEYALDDRNSQPANKNEKEDDFSSADMIISIRTGGTKLYIGIIVLSMLVLGGVIFLVNKKITSKEIVYEKEVK